MGTIIVIAIIGYMVYLSISTNSGKSEIPYDIHPDDADLINKEDKDWWSTLTIDALKELENHDNAKTLLLYNHYLEKEGLSKDEALAKLGINTISYYLTLQQRKDKPILEGDNAKLPFLLKGRINRYIIEGRINFSNNDSEHVHAIIRRALKKSIHQETDEPNHPKQSPLEDEIIAHEESTSEDTASYLEENENDFFDDGNSNKVVLTSPYNPVPEVQSEEGLHHYLLKLSKLTHSDLCIELSHVLAAKYNLMILPSSANEFKERQEKVTDLTDKVVAISIQEFGSDIIMNYGGRDISKFNELVNSIDAEVAQEDLHPQQHGCKILNKLRQALAIDLPKIKPHEEHEQDLNLINAVKKVTNKPQGTFANIHDDLGVAVSQLGIIPSNENTYQEKLFLMSYAYARRTVSAGLLLQGVFNLDGYMHSSIFFKSMQLQTIQTKEFQIVAANLASELISSYDKRLTPALLSKITTTAEVGNVKTTRPNDYDETGSLYQDLGHITYEDLILSLELEEIPF